ncbi:MAG: helix-turn-helix transcriptional regulator [Myxococcales bacterium]|nr:helix-turn-helix transcriptional regulator [Myxococcales bacterium]
MRYALLHPDVLEVPSAKGDLAVAADLLLDDDATIVQASARAHDALAGATRLALESTTARRAWARRSGAFRLNPHVAVVLRPLSSPTWPQVVARGYLADTSRRQAGLRSVLRSLFGLTIVESRVAELAMEGAATDELAQRLGIARGTAQVHLRNIFRKVGVHRQAELVACLWRSIPRWE